MLAGALANALAVLNSERLVLGGGLRDARPGLLPERQEGLRSRAPASRVLAADDRADRVALARGGSPAGAVGPAVLPRGLAAPTAAPPGAPVESDPQVTAPDAVASDTT